MNPVLLPCSAAKYEASGFNSARIDSMVLGRLPSLIAVLPVSTGIETFNKQRMENLRSGVYCCLIREFNEPARFGAWVRRTPRDAAVVSQRQNRQSPVFYSYSRLLAGSWR